MHDCKQHLPDVLLEVEWNQVQHNCLPDWPIVKPIWVLPDLLHEQVEPRQSNNMMNDTTRQQKRQPESNKT